MAGEVIGINSQIFSRTGGFMGVSFAISDRRGAQTSQSSSSRPAAWSAAASA